MSLRTEVRPGLQVPGTERIFHKMMSAQGAHIFPLTYLSPHNKLGTLTDR